jgi:hypothetical protein
VASNIDAGGRLVEGLKSQPVREPLEGYLKLPVERVVFFVMKETMGYAYINEKLINLRKVIKNHSKYDIIIKNYFSY